MLHHPMEVQNKEGMGFCKQKLTRSLGFASVATGDKFKLLTVPGQRGEEVGVGALQHGAGREPRHVGAAVDVLGAAARHR